MLPVRHVVGWFAIALLVLGLAFYGAGRGLAQVATPVPEEVPVGRPAHIHTGTCETLDPNPLVPLTDVVAPEGDAVGSAEATAAEISVTTGIALDLATMLATDHAINVHLSQEQADVYIACGEIGGVPHDAAGSLAIGLREQNDSGFSGVAYLTPNATDPTLTDVSLFLVEEVEEEDEDVEDEEDEDTAAAAGEVEVSLTDFAIDMPETLPAGSTTFVVTNDGDATHGFEIESEELGVEEGLEQNLEPGQSATLEVDLEAGTYEVYCPVGNHADMGMSLEVTVE
jgi:hypothetical protein